MKRVWPLAVAPVAFLLYFFGYPLVRIISMTIGGWREALAIPGLDRVFAFTFGQAVLSTFLTLLVGLPVTAAFSRHLVPGRRWMEAVLSMPFVLPTVVVGAAFVALGFKGSFWGIVLAHVFYNVSVVIRIVGPTWTQLGHALEEAAATLGAGPVKRFRHIMLPLLAPSLGATASLVFLFTFTSFGVVVILGGLELATVEVAIWREATGMFRLGAAAALALVQLVLVSGVLYLFARIQRKRAVALPVTVLPPSKPPSALAWIWLTFGLVASMTPILLLVVGSLRVQGRWSAAAWLNSSTDLAVATGNSLLFATVATVVAVIIGGLSAWFIAKQTSGVGTLIDVLVMLPLGTSAVTIGLGMLVALDRPVDLRGSWLLVPLAHSLVAIPFVMRILVPSLRAIGGDLGDAAAVLGASPRRVWREVELPLVRRALGAAAAFAAAISIGEFGATAFLVRPASTTLPALVFRSLSRPGPLNLAAALAAASVLLVLVGGVVTMADPRRQKL